MNKRCMALTQEQYERCIELLRYGFELDGKLVKPNNRIATLEVTQATLGLRLGDCLNLRMSSFIKDGSRWRLDIVEQKTKKVREFTVPSEVYLYLQGYALEGGILPNAKLFDVSERQVERHLNKVFTKMGLALRNYGSHSFRKYFSSKVYVDNGHDIILVQKLLQHSSPQVTLRYIGISPKAVEEALHKTAAHLI